MFWRTAGFSQPSPIEAILERSNFTLEDILDEDDLVQECKSLNSRLINFLKDRSVIEKLIRYLVEPPPENADVKRRYKYPYLACEIFTCEIEIVFTTILEGFELPDLLFSLLDRPVPLPPVLAGYFAKVVGSLLTRQTVACMHYLQSRQHLLGYLVRHLGTTSIAEVIMQLVGADDQILMFHSESLQWLGETSLLELVLDSLAPEHSHTVHANAAEVLTAIARTLPSALASQLSSPMYLARLFQHAQAEGPGQPQGMVLDVCMALLDPKRATLYARTGYMDAQDQVVQPGPPPPLVHFCIRQLETLVPQLPSSPSASGEDSVLHTTYGELTPALGTLRLKIVEFLAVLVQAVVYRAPNLKPEMQKELLRLDAVYKCLTLFFEYPFNSLLHNNVEMLLISVLESGQEQFLNHLLVRCQLLTALASAPLHVFPKGGKMSMRAGYQGHITQLGSRISEMLSRGDSAALHSAAKDNKAWTQWIAVGLKDRQQLENLSSWSCGRPVQLTDTGSDQEEDPRSDFGLCAMANQLNDAYRRYEDDGDDKEDEDLDSQEGALFIDSTEVLAAVGYSSSSNATTSGPTSFMSLQIRGDGVDSDSSDDSDEDGEQGPSAIALLNPFSAGASGEVDEDDVLIVTSEDEEDEEIEASAQVKPFYDGECVSTLAQGLSGNGAGATVNEVQASLEQQLFVSKDNLQDQSKSEDNNTEEDAQFNTFNYWRCAFVNIPDDI